MTKNEFFPMYPPRKVSTNQNLYAPKLLLNDLCRVVKNNYFSRESFFSNDDLRTLKKAVEGGFIQRGIITTCSLNEDSRFVVYFETEKKVLMRLKCTCFVEAGDSSNLRVTLNRLDKTMKIHTLEAISLKLPEILVIKDTIPLLKGSLCDS